MPIDRGVHMGLPGDNWALIAGLSAYLVSCPIFERNTEYQTLNQHSFVRV